MITNLVAAIVVTLVTNVTETDNHQNAHPLFFSEGIQQAPYVAADKKWTETEIRERTELVSVFEGREVRQTLKDVAVTNWTEHFEIIPAQWRRTKVEPGAGPIKNSEPVLLQWNQGWKLTPNSGPAYERLGLGVLRRDGAAEEDTSPQDSHGAFSREMLRFMGTTVRDDLMELTNRLTKLREALRAASRD